MQDSEAVTPEVATEVDPQVPEATQPSEVVDTAAKETEPVVQPQASLKPSKVERLAHGATIETF